MRYLHSFLTTTLLWVATTAVFAQPANNPKGQVANNASSEKCFPSGSSFKQGSVSSDDKYALFTTVNDLIKVFSVEDGRLVMATKDFKETERYWGPNPVVNYKLSRKNNSYRTGEPQTFYIEDLAGTRVASFEVNKQMREYFDPASGSLITNKSMHDDVYLIQPNKKPRKIMKTSYPYLDNGTVCDKLGRYMIFVSGSVVNLETGKVRTEEFVVNKKRYTTDVRIRVSDDASQYAVNVVDGTIEIHDLPTGKLLKKIQPHPDLPKNLSMDMLPISPDGDYISWLNFNNPLASAGLAYLVKNGVCTSFCDPLWDEESSEQYFQTLKKALLDFKEEDDRKTAAAARAHREALEAPLDGKTMLQVDNGQVNALTSDPSTPAATINYIAEINVLVGKANALNSNIQATQKSLIQEMKANTNPNDLMTGETLRKYQEISNLIAQLQSTYSTILSKSTQMRQQVRGTSAEKPALLDFIDVASYNSRNGTVAMNKLQQEWDKIRNGAQQR